MAITNTPILGLPYAGADTDETYAVLGRLFVKDGQKLTLPEIVDMYTPTVGKVYINAADWTAADGTEDEYDAKITISGVESNSMILLYPDTENDAEKAKNLGIRAKAASGVANDDTFVIVRATGGDPTVTEGISLVYIALRGYAVWSAGITPPAMPYATVIGVGPYIATEEGDRDDIAASQRLVTEAVTAIRSTLSTLTTGLADTNKAVELRLKSADLPTKLDEYRSEKGLIDKTVSDLVNYYTKSQTMTKNEINALVSAIPKFKIEVVTSLPASNISDTTVYLVKSGDDDSNLYTEYIRAGGKWEKLGTQTVDLTGYATEAWVNDILAAYVKTVDMETYVTGLLNAYQPAGDYLTPATGDQRYAAKQTTEDKLTDHGNKISQLEEALANSMVEFAESVEWLNAHGDTSKRYYLPDGYEYAYTQKTETVEIKHRVDPAQFMANKRPNASGTISSDSATCNGAIATPAIEVNTNGVWSDCWVNISGMDKMVATFYACFYCYYYLADGTYAGFYFANNSLGITSAAEEDVNLPVRFNIDRSYDNTEGKRWQDIKYVRFMVGLSNAALDSTNPAPNLNINFERLDRTETQTTWAWRSTGVLHSNDAATIKNTEDIAALRVDVDGLTENVESLMESAGSIVVNTGEVLYAVGDSITYGTNVGGNANAWPTHLIRINGYDAENSKNLGISGIGFCTTASGKTVRGVVDGQSFAVADIVTVAIGINDWKNSSATVENFFTEMYYCLNKIRTDNPYCRIYYILPFNFKVGAFASFYALGFKGEGDTALCYGNTLQQFVNKIKAKFEDDSWKALNIHVIDMTKNPAITRYNLETTLGDGLHPTVECHKELAKEIALRIINT